MGLLRRPGRVRTSDIGDQNLEGGRRVELAREGHEERLKSDLEVRFEEVARILADLDMEAIWTEADERERRVLVENLLE